MYYIDKVCKSFNKGNIVANNDICLEIREGEIFGFLGPNGAGKTTLIKQMIGLLKPDKGKIRFYDIDVVKEPGKITGFIGYMPQKIGALRDLTVREALMITGKLKGCESKSLNKSIPLLMDELNLKKAENSLLKNLSGGQSRLVAFCTCLIGEPKIIFLDEPTNDIDPVTRKIIWDKISYINKTQKTTVVLVTHNVMEAERVLEKVAVIDKGNIKFSGSVKEFKEMVSHELKVTIEFSKDFESKKILFSDSGLKYSFSDEYKCCVFIKEEQELRKLMDIIFHEGGFKTIEKFDLGYPTLEDAYINLFGKVGV